MSNQAYEKLHKLVAFLIINGIVSKAKLSQVLDMSLIDFLAEFEDEIKELDKQFEKRT